MLRLPCLTITTGRSYFLLGRRSTTAVLSSTFLKQVTPPIYHNTNKWCHFSENRSQPHLINSPRLFNFIVRVSDSLNLFQERTETIMADARYCVEYAKTGRSACKKCKSQIEKGVSRIGKITTNPFSDDGGEMKVWYHTRCMFETLKVLKFKLTWVIDCLTLLGLTPLVDIDSIAGMIYTCMYNLTLIILSCHPITLMCCYVLSGNISHSQDFKGPCRNFNDIKRMCTSLKNQTTLFCV